MGVGESKVVGYCPLVDSVIAGGSASVSIYKVIQRGFCVGRSAYFCLRAEREEEDEEEEEEEEEERERDLESESESDEYLRFFLLLRCLCFLLLFLTFLEDFLVRLGLRGGSSGASTPSSSIST